MSIDNARALIDAWENPGKRPDIHRAWQRKLRREWPTLAKAIEQFIEGEKRGENREH